MFFTEEQNGEIFIRFVGTAGQRETEKMKFDLAVMVSFTVCVMCLEGLIFKREYEWRF